jgi:hypothetical protein
MFACQSKLVTCAARRYYDCCPDDSNWPVVIYTLTLCRASIIYSLKIMVPQVGQRGRQGNSAVA